MTQTSPYQHGYEAVRAQAGAFVAKVYGWMSVGLLLTAVVALATANTPSLVRTIFASRGVFFGLIIGELVLVVALSAAIERIPAALATFLFLAYAAVNGLTLSVIFLVYTRESLASTFFVTAGTFGVLSVYGHYTRRDLTSVGNLCLMALVGLVIASLVNLFWANNALYWIVTYAGVAIFVGLTAYDAQKIRLIGLSIGQDGQVVRKVAIMGALALYLDFINLFLLLLRLLGRRR